MSKVNEAITPEALENYSGNLLRYAFHEKKKTLRASKNGIALEITKPQILWSEKKEDPNKAENRWRVVISLITVSELDKKKVS